MLSRLVTDRSLRLELRSWTRRSQIHRWVVVRSPLSVLSLPLTGIDILQVALDVTSDGQLQLPTVSLEPHLCDLQYYNLPFQLRDWQESHDFQWHSYGRQRESGRDNGAGTEQHSEACQLGLAGLLGWRRSTERF
jgi:hypothetical protein